jgi:hypothetical protein
VSYSRTRSGIYVPMGLGADPPGKMLIPSSAGGSNNALDQTKGFLSDQARSEADKRYQSLGLGPSWVPTSDKMIGPWAEEQTKLFAGPVVQSGIDEGRKAFETYMKIPSPDGMPFSKEEVQAWAEHYLGAHGYPSSTDAAIHMARDFVIANCDAIGLPPEFIVASRLVDNFPPATLEDAAVWTAQLSSAFLGSFGVPLVDSFDASSFLSACARVAVAQTAPGIPFSFFEETFAALSDGVITRDEAKGIVIGAAGIIGGLIGQAFGIPAPIAAFFSQLLVGAIIAGVSDALGWGPTDSEKLQAAQGSAQAAANTAARHCTDLATALWLEYQHYWDAIVKDLNATIRSSAEWLTPEGYCSSTAGIRLWGPTSLDTVYSADGVPLTDKKGAVRQYQYPVTRNCFDSQGCPYLSVGIESLVTRDKYALSPSELGRVPAIRKEGPGCDGTSALAFWNARRYVTPNQVLFAMKGKPLQWVEPSSYRPTELKSYNAPSWGETLQSDAEYLASIGYVGVGGRYGTDVGQCMTPPWGGFMLRSLEQTAAATALVQRDIARTVSAASTAYGIKYHMDKLAGVEFQVADAAKKRAAVQKLAAMTAALRHAMMEARRRGMRKADLLNYGLVAAGGAALFGFGAAKVWK